MSSNAAPIRFVTGVDRHYFDQIFLLLGSLQQSSPSIHLYVCDFGLTEPQQHFLRLRGSLLEAPADMPPARHPWDYKAALGRYVAQWPDDPIVWLDSDLVILDDLAASLGALNQKMAEDEIGLAVCGCSTLAEQQGVDPARHYASLVASYDQSLPYLNSGFFLCRSHVFLEEWNAQCAAMTLEMLYEQNAFNLVAYRGGKILLLDPDIWNAANALLMTMRPDLQDGRLAIWTDDKRINVLHLTSSDRARDLFQGQFVFDLNGYRMESTFRLLRREDFQPLLASLISDGIYPEREWLIQSGLAVPN